MGRFSTISENELLSVSQNEKEKIFAEMNYFLFTILGLKCVVKRNHLSDVTQHAWKHVFHIVSNYETINCRKHRLGHLKVEV